MAELTKVYNDTEIQDELRDIYAQYHNSIKIFIGQLEVLQNKFPVEILNEIRAVFSHIAKIYVCENKDIAVKNLAKAKGHIKRAQLDAFKYMCYAYSSYYNSFRELYKNVDLSYVNNGDFIVQLSQLYASAMKKAEKAREIESTTDDVIEAYNYYEEAYCEYAKLYNLVAENISIIGKLQQKEQLQQQEANEKFDLLHKDNEMLKDEIISLKEENAKEKKKNSRLTVVTIGLSIISIILGFMALG
ncbi:MAG: hypothetical protein U0L79_07740 [Lachnospiraceae bacterium]|nr:hypothetical protein [Lachnospiraceae bacterium]